MIGLAIVFDSDNTIHHRLVVRSEQELYEELWPWLTDVSALWFEDVCRGVWRRPLFSRAAGANRRLILVPFDDPQELQQLVEGLDRTADAPPAVVPDSRRLRIR